jgi:hypothetical protein
MTTGDSLDHILPTRRQAISWSDDKRVGLIYADCWINYPEVKAIRGTVHAVYGMPAKIQAQCVMISGDPGMGKTSLFSRIESDLETLRKRSEEPRGYISFTVPPDPTLSGFEESIEKALGVSIGRIRGGILPASLTRAVEMRRIRMVLIDEVHNLLNANRVDQRKNLSFFRALSSPPLSLCITAFGTEDAHHAISSDSQLARRFQRYHLPLWSENENFRSFLAAYESYLPLKKPSELWGAGKVKYLLKETAGNTDAIVKRITRGAVWAILDGKESIDLKCLEKTEGIPPYFESFDDEG